MTSLAIPDLDSVVTVDTAAVHRLLPHRPPFQFVDRAEFDLASGVVRTWHLFRADEPYFRGHFPNDPIVPGVVLLECMAQAGRLLLNARIGGIRPGFLVGVDSARFNQTVRPGDELRIEARLLRSNADLDIDAYEGDICGFKCAAFLGATRCARAQINLYQAHSRRASRVATDQPKGAGSTVSSSSPALPAAVSPSLPSPSLLPL